MSRPVSADDLSRCALFQGLEQDERQQLFDLMTYEVHPKGGTILEEGRSIQVLWLLLRGRCAVTKHTKTNGDQQLAVLEPSSVFGEISFVSPAPHSASVRALTEVEVLRLSREKYDRLLEAGSKAAYKVAMNVAHVLAQRLRQMDDWACELVERPDGKAHKEEWHEFRSRLFTDWQF